MAEGLGAKLIDDSELVNDMIKQAKNRISRSDFTISVKIRIHSDIRSFFFFSLTFTESIIVIYGGQLHLSNYSMNTLTLWQFVCLVALHAIIQSILIVFPN